MSPFICPQGTNNSFVPWGTTISYTQERGGKHFLHTEEGRANISYIQERGGQTFLTHRRGSGKTCFVGGGGGFDDVDEEMDVSRANFLVREANMFVEDDRNMAFLGNYQLWKTTFISLAFQILFLFSLFLLLPLSS